MNTHEYRAKIGVMNVEQMGDSTEWDRHGHEVFGMVHEMADEIDRLRAENERLRLSVDILTKQCGEM